MGGLWPFPSSGFDASQRVKPTSTRQQEQHPGQRHQEEGDAKTQETTSTTTSTVPPVRSRSNEHDPADAFFGLRRFADEQMQILADGLATIPAIFSEMQARGTSSRWRPDDTQHVRLSSPMSNQPPYPKEAIACARTLLIQSRNANAAAGVTPSSILNLYRDYDDHEMSLTMHSPWSSFLVNPLQTHHPWLSIDWFKYSKYSPTNLENHRHAHQHGSMWRAAFEDLMSASLGKEEEESGRGRDAWTGRTNDQGRYAAWAATPRDWMLGLQCRGVLPPQLPDLYQLGSRSLIDRVFSRLIDEDQHGIPPVADFWQLVSEIGTFDADERRGTTEVEAGTSTELDAYEHFLGRANDRTGREGVPTAEEEKERQQEQQQQWSTRLETRSVEEAPAEDETATLRILSTLSTTERTTMPDGTVTTKVVLRKRFADGREETTETVSTTHGQQTRQEEGSMSTALLPVSDSKGRQEKQSRAWFWS